MSGMRRRALGVLLIIAAPAAVGIGYVNAPSAGACSRINNLNQALGEGPTCSTVPSAAYFVAGALMVIAGVLTIVPWWRRLVED
jgi:UPF0716 family protein affecting phage T7 exclusion